MYKIDRRGGEGGPKIVLLDRPVKSCKGLRIKEKVINKLRAVILSVEDNSV